MGGCVLRSRHGLGAPREARRWKKQEGKEGTGGASMVSESLGASSRGTPAAGARQQGRDGYGNGRKMGAGWLGRGEGELAGGKMGVKSCRG